MTGAVLLFSGVFAIAYGSWRGYAAARQAVRPPAGEGDETRAILDASRPAHARSRVRVAMRQTGLSLGWVAVAMYGCYLATVGLAVGS